MKDGCSQQVDTPQNLYDYPANLFVGSFIGSPQMNFFDAKLVKRADGVWAEFGSNAIKVPDAKVRKLVDESYIGKEVVMGIRPENIHDEERFLSVADNNLVEAKVEVVELMGSETYLYLKVDGKESNVVARVDPRSTSRTGDTVKVAFETTRLPFFDKDTELSILNRSFTAYTTPASFRCGRFLYAFHKNKVYFAKLGEIFFLRYSFLPGYTL